LRKLLAVGGLLLVVATTSSAASTGVSRDYQRDLNRPARDFSLSIATISDVVAKSLRYPLPPTAAREAAAKLTTVRLDLRDAASRLQAIQPPRAVAKHHALLIKAATKLRAELAPLIAKLHKGQYAVVATLPGLPGLLDVHRGLAGLKKGGYRIASG
jgi:hypothetical protein